MYAGPVSYTPISPIYTGEGGAGAMGEAQRGQIDRMTAKEQFQIKRKEKELEAVKTERALIGELRTKELALKAAIGSLASPQSNVLGGSKTCLARGEESTLEASATGSAFAGKFRVNITALATPTQHLGKGGCALGLSTTNDLSNVTVAMLPVGYPVLPAAGQTGSFYINGQHISFTGDDSVQSVLDQIQTATDNAVQASYEATTDKVTLSSATQIRYRPSPTSNLLEALGLVFSTSNTVQSASAIGTADLSSSLTNARLETALTPTGSFSINGIDFSYDASKDSLSSLQEVINSTAAAGATLNYDSTQDRFVLCNSQNGSLDLLCQDTSGNFLEALGLADPNDVSLGDNTRFSIDGGPTQESANSVLTQADHGKHGVTIVAKALGEDVVTVSKDTQAMAEALNKVIDAYNAIQTFIKNNIEKNKGIDRQGIRQILEGHQRSLYTLFCQTPDSLQNAAVNNFFQLGILRTSNTSEKNLQKLEASGKKTLEALFASRPSAASTLLQTVFENVNTWIDSSISENPAQGQNFFSAAEGVRDRKIHTLEADLDKLKRQNEAARKKTLQSMMTIENASLMQSQGQNLTTESLTKQFENRK